MFESNKNFKEDLKISYLNLLADYDYQEEFSNLYDERNIIKLISKKTSHNILIKVKKIITYQKEILENIKISKEGMKR